MRSDIQDIGHDYEAVAPTGCVRGRRVRPTNLTVHGDQV